MEVSRRSVLKGAAGLAAAGVGSSHSRAEHLPMPRAPPRNTQPMSSFAVPARRASPPQFALQSWACRSSSSRRNRASGDVASSTQATFPSEADPLPRCWPASRTRRTNCLRDLTDWTIVQANGFPSYRYNDHEVIRAYANYNTGLQDFLSRNGVVCTRTTPDNSRRQRSRQLVQSDDALGHPEI